MATRDSGLTDFLMNLQDACTVDETRDRYLESVGGLIQAECFALYRFDVGTGEVVDCVAEAPDAFLDQYERIGRRDDPVLEAAVRDMAPRDDRTAADQGRSWEESGAYEVLDRAGLAYSLEAPVRIGGHLAGTLNFARTADQPPFDSEDLNRAEQAGRAISAALLRAARFDESEHRANLLTDVLNLLDTALVISHVDGEQLFSNDAAQAAVDGSERPLVNAVAPAFRETLDALRRHGEQTSSARRTLELADRVAETGARSVRLGPTGEFVLTFLDFQLVEEAKPPAEPSEARLPLLSPREREVAELVARGLTTGEMSRELFISQNTVKQHLKRMFQKLEVNNRAQLVARLWSPEAGATEGS